MHRVKPSKYPLLLILFGVIISGCTDNKSKSASSAGTDSNTPSAIDTTQHPNGVTTGSVISTDTSAMTVDSFVNRKKDTTGGN